MKTCIICGTTFSPPPYTNPTVCPDPSCGLECIRRGQAAFREQRKQQRERAKQERKQERERARQAQKRAMAADKAASLLLEQTDDLDAALILV